MPWTDIWCFTCSHEIRLKLTGYAHIDPDDLNGCPCADEEGCHP